MPCYVWARAPSACGLSCRTRRLSTRLRKQKKAHEEPWQHHAKAMENQAKTMKKTMKQHEPSKDNIKKINGKDMETHESRVVYPCLGMLRCMLTPPRLSLSHGPPPHRRVGLKAMGRRVAVIGAGPAGLAACRYLKKWRGMRETAAFSCFFSWFFLGFGAFVGCFLLAFSISKSFTWCLQPKGFSPGSAIDRRSSRQPKRWAAFGPRSPATRSSTRV